MIPRRFPAFLLFFSFLISLTASPVSAEKVFREITVQKGETLAIIAKKHLEDPNRWKELLQYNNIKTPNLIYPGMKIKIPDFLARSPVALVLGFRGMEIRTGESDSHWESARMQQKLYPGDAIRTGKSGYGKIAYRDGITIEMEPGSEMILNVDGKLQSTDVSTVFLRTGSLRSIVSKKKDGAPNPYSVRSPTAIASVRGTEFVTEQDEKKTFTVSCEEGSVEVEAGGKKVLLHKGEGTRVVDGGTPVEPVSLPFPPPIRRSP